MGIIRVCVYIWVYSTFGKQAFLGTEQKAQASRVLKYPMYVYIPINALERCMHGTYFHTRPEEARQRFS